MRVLNSLFKFLTAVFFLGHINNLYNTCFWCLVQQSGLTTDQAEGRLNVSAFSKLSLMLLE